MSDVMPAAGAAGMDIRGFIESSLIEWPGKVAAAIFVAGCNWRCPYCHGWRFVQSPQQMGRFSVKQVLDSLAAQTGWIDGLVLSGGEPTLQPGLPAFVEAVDAIGMEVKLHSNGSRPAIIERLLQRGQLGCLALDLKAPLAPAPMARSTGVAADPEALGASIQAGAAAGVPMEFHTTLCPACLDEAALAEMAALIAREAPAAAWVWQQYNPGDVLAPAAAGSRVYAAEEVEAWAARLRGVHARIEVRGLRTPASSVQPTN